MKKIVTFGEIMMRLSPPGALRFGQARSFDVVYGGGESNVAVSLANFGLETEFVTWLPAHEIGEACLQFLRQYNVGTRHVGEVDAAMLIEHRADEVADILRQRVHAPGEHHQRAFESLGAGADEQIHVGRGGDAATAVGHPGPDPHWRPIYPPFVLACWLVVF